MTPSQTDKFEIASLVIAFIALVAILKLGLLAALLPGLLIYQLVHLIAPLFVRMGVAHEAGRTFALVIPLVIVGGLGGLAIIQIITFLAGPESFAELLQRMAEIVGTARQYLPAWAQDYLPGNIDELETTGAKWLRENAGGLRGFGQDAGHMVFHTVLGLVVGGLVALYSARERPLGPLAQALEDRTEILSNAFRNVVFSQVRISALNTILTAIYLAGVLPLVDVHLPLVKTMIAVTFIVGLLPVIGNLISNTVIVIVSLSVSLEVAVGSLVFLVVIHKLEYFVNARIIGSRINARAWELLTAMLAMEAAFGLAGLIAAPIYYAYMKEELTRRGLI